MKVTIHNNAFPKDTAFEIPGIGLVINHETTEVNDLQVAMYKSYGYDWPESGDLVIDQNEPVNVEPLNSSDSETATQPGSPVGFASLTVPPNADTDEESN